MRTQTQLCTPCPANTYCRPCAQGELCGLNRVHLDQCFLGAVSAPGSTGVQNCTCTSGLVALRRGRNQDLYYCSAVPPMAIYDTEQQRVECAPGWRATWKNGQLIECTLCDVGMFASLPITPTLHCTPCPVGTYADTRDAIGNCTSCPFSLSTASAGTTSIAGCGCPPPLTLAAGGGCLGCRADQYFDGGSCHTCPAHSISKPGGLGCQCAAGYYFSGAGACELCPVGTYAASAGAVACTGCPAGSSTVGVGSRSVRECSQCADKYVWMGTMGCMLTALLSSA
jgi:hypothetical protein